MKVYIIGAGPGDPKLITVRGAELIEQCPVVLYTGSLVSKAVIARADKNALVLDSASMDLDEIMGIFIKAKADNLDVARVHTGDPSIFGSTAEQMRRMQEEGIDYEIIPGVSSFLASAAVLGKELTLPELTQTIIISRCEGRTSVPDKEKLSMLAEHQCTLVLFLSAALIHKVVDELSPHYGKDCPVAVVQRATWPNQLIVRGTLDDIADKIKQAKIKSTAIIIIGRVLTSTDFADSKLYSPEFSHGFRS
ncbi:MAG: precorrin-4 C(11)-methyltransferase [Candidatus Scalindua sp. AMX11]|nr:MAG: precorrin-4 C(11)-methyltransferase [Candidatus Scalindua sp.]NOG84470.1 precorrin-4 C(11)-methyltransferase [Planctomycetota bacterium]RZV80518.1 MAG: precorrin-4 C(11)-methyltransferase [Candidatus Scalindua sp. SCAELEC01]TDE65264.1 MAG: precorrin-4 C(11)-methyltransferase [Candidatus Scalindua sp. AMX11]GJQ58471.1 MAG: precorrin-4 C(11)-methyltransferase [Candidatus Scalindua sp.]